MVMRMDVSRQSEHERYSSVWFSTFLDTIPAEQTAREVAFLERQLPLSRHRTVLDLCCGAGRHAIPLAHSGHEVTGVDRDPAALARARSANTSRATFIEADVRSVLQDRGRWSAAIIMWASFGYFTAEQNRAILGDIVRSLEPGGRLVLDVYNRDWFEAHQGEHRRERAGIHLTETKHVVGDRLSVELRYDGHDAVDRFSWQVFTPAGLVHVLNDSGLRLVTQCAGFDESVPPTSDQPRMQVVAERAGDHRQADDR
jgi:SAM-dependent methyltransferase